jgi:Mrp family chromosome partitioning ATPase
MTRYREASSRQDRNYVPADARIFSRATEPSEPYYPKKLPILGASFGGGLLLMAILTLLGELFSGRATVPARGARLEPAHNSETVPTIHSATERQAVSAHPSAIVPQEIAKEREMGVERAARQLVERGAGRALFVSPEGDEAAASSVLVAREIADAGVRVVLIDLTANGVAGKPMLDGRLVPGITNLLAATSQFTDVIHVDLYSDAHVIPTGTAEPELAMRGIDRLPMILDALDSAYAIVIVECGPVGAKSIRRLIGEHCDLFLSVVDRNSGEVIQTTEALEAEGYTDLTLVTPVGHVTPTPPVPGRNAA